MLLGGLPSELIDEIAAEILSFPLDQFTSLRNAKAKALKASGQADLARAVAALKKPSLPLWAVNQLARRDRAALEWLRDAGQGVVKAQQAAVAGRSNAADALRQASARLQRQLESTARIAATALQDNRHAAGPEAQRRIYEILRQAAVQGAEAWTRLERGALVAEPPAADDVLGTFGSTLPAAGAAARNREAQAAARMEIAHARRVARADAASAERAANTARRLRQEATEMAAAAQRAAERAKAAETEAARAQRKAHESERGLDG